MPMASPSIAASIQALRQAARLYVDATSLRNAAREIGMSPTGLRGFIEGADPYLKTKRRLTEWYVRELETRSAELTAESARTALSLLLKHYPPARRDEAAAEVLVVLDHWCRTTETPQPGWLGELQEEVG